MKKITFIIILLSFLKVYSQNDIINHFILEYDGGINRCRNNKIRLSIMSPDFNDKFTDVFATVDKKEFKTQISKEKYVTICEKLINLNPKDIIEDAQLYLDSTTTSLTFGVYSNHVTYSVSGLSKGDENTSRKHFLEVVIMILEIADIKIQYIN